LPACLARPLALLTSKLFFSSCPAKLENCLATAFTFVPLRGIGTPSTCLRRRLEISARPAKAATAVAAAAAAVPFATVPAPLRAWSAMESTVLPIEPTLSPAAPTLVELPPPFEARLFGLGDLPRLEVDRAREEPEAFFADLLLLLDAERELALFLGLAVLGKGSSWSTDSRWSERR
jgi:hypothetical protein